MSLIQLPVSLLALLSITRLVSADCYVAAYSLVGKQSGWVACPGTASSPGGAETCCIPGSECGEDSICHVPASQNPGSDAWYVAGCTDSSYSDPVCNNVCVGYTQTYIQYQSSAGAWMCCGDGGCNGTVTDDTFAGPSPQDWQVITGSTAPASEAPSPTSTKQTTPADPTSADPTATSQAPTTSNAAATSNEANIGSSSATATSSKATRTDAITSGDFKPSPLHRTAMTGSLDTGPSASATSGADSSNSSPNSNSNDKGGSSSGGLSIGAQAGIGAAIGVAALALIVGLIAIYMLKKNRKNRERIPEEIRMKDEVHLKMDDRSSYVPPYSPYAPSGTHARSTVSELPTNPPVYEMGGAENEVRNKQWRPW